MDSTASATDFYQLGLGHLQRGDLRSAYEEFREAARIDPTNFEIWQQYEETYREVENDIDAQHRHFTIGTRQQVMTPRQSSLRTTRSASIFEDIGEDVDDAHARAVFLRGGSLFTDWKPEEQAAEDNLEMVTRSPRLYFAVLVAWLMTFLLVIYFLRARVRDRKMPIWEHCLWILLALAALVYVVRRHRQRPLRVTASDVIKILCVLVVFVCSLYHISQQNKPKLTTAAPSSMFEWKWLCDSCGTDAGARCLWNKSGLGDCLPCNPRQNAGMQGCHSLSWEVCWWQQSHEHLLGGSSLFSSAQPFRQHPQCAMYSPRT